MGGGGQANKWMPAAALWLCGGVIGLWALTAAPASAGAWVRPAGSGLTITTASHHAFALSTPDTAFSKIETAIYAEYGLTDRLTVVGRVARETRFRRSARQISKAGSVYTLSLNTVSQGWGELETGLRLRAFEHRDWVVSTQVSAIRSPADLENGLRARPVWGSDVRILVGRSLGGNMFADAQLAHRNRSIEGGAEQRMDLTFGVRPAQRWLVMAQTYSAWGERSGGSDYESHRVHISVTAPIADRLSLQFGAINSFYSDGLAPERAYMLALWREF